MTMTTLSSVQVCHMLEQEARRCYQQGCLSNIYHPQLFTSKPNLERERKMVELANSTQPGQVETLFQCAVIAGCVEEGCYRHCSQQFFRGLLRNYQHKQGQLA